MALMTPHTSIDAGTIVTVGTSADTTGASLHDHKTNTCAH